MSTPSSPFLNDWQDLKTSHQIPDCEISDDPAEELPPETIESINEEYEQHVEIGTLRATDEFQKLLQSRREALEEKVEEIGWENGKLDLEELSDKRNDTLSNFGDEEAERFGWHLTILYEYMGISYDQLAQVTGISRSTVYKIMSRRNLPGLPSIIRISASLGLHKSLLLADFETVEIWNELLRFPSGVGMSDIELERTTEEMQTMLFGEESDEGFDPAQWLTEVEEAATEVSQHFSSPGGVLGGVIGRHHGGRKGAYICGYYGHKLRKAVRKPDSDSESLPFPSRFVKAVLRHKLQ